MRRLGDWEIRLRAYLERVRELPFDWGEDQKRAGVSHDCCLFSDGAVEAMTGESAMAEFRGRYRTAIGAARALRRYGAGTLEATLTAKFGEPLPAALVMRGDIIMRDEPPIGAIGISVGPVGLFVGQEGERNGLVALPRGAWICGWRVPF